MANKLERVFTRLRRPQSLQAVQEAYAEADRAKALAQELDELKRTYDDKIEQLNHEHSVQLDQVTTQALLETIQAKQQVLDQLYQDNLPNSDTESEESLSPPPTPPSPKRPVTPIPTPKPLKPKLKKDPVQAWSKSIKKMEDDKTAVAKAVRKPSPPPPPHARLAKRKWR